MSTVTDKKISEKITDRIKMKEVPEITGIDLVNFVESKKSKSIS